MNKFKCMKHECKYNYNICYSLNYEYCNVDRRIDSKNAYTWLLERVNCIISKSCLEKYISMILTHRDNK